MHPILHDFGFWTLYWYGPLLAAAYLIALQFAAVRARQRGIDSTKVMDLGIYLIIAALVGAKLMLLVVDFEGVMRNPASLLRAAGVFYGGLIGALIAAIWLVRRYQLPLWTTADLFAPGIALGHVIGRMGCLMAGCCYGRPTTLPWGITFTSPIAAEYSGTPLNQPLHPTQVYDAAGELLILAILLATERRGRPFPGRTFWGYIVLYGISRFIVEAFRGDPERGIYWTLSTSQWVSLLMIPIALLMLTRLSRRGAPAAA